MGWSRFRYAKEVQSVFHFLGRVGIAIFAMVYFFSFHLEVIIVVKDHRSIPFFYYKQKNKKFYQNGEKRTCKLMKL